METIKIFISSRVNSKLSGIGGNHSLRDLRVFLREQLEAASFLDKQPLEVLINEQSFTGTLSQNAFDNCMRELRSANIIIILYNGEAGWAVAKSVSANGICHEEALVAMAEFSAMSYVIDLRAFAGPAGTQDQVLADQSFARDMIGAFPTMTAIAAQTFTELRERTLQQIRLFVLDGIHQALVTQKSIVSGSDIFGDTLDWSKLTYAERKELLEEKLADVFEPMTAFSKVYKRYHGIPDNMSVADARNMIGRPFLHEHVDIRGTRLKSGIIHFVAVYGNITEGQAKGLVGYPDITVIRTSFGVYLWEKNMHIQIFFLKGCINPQTIKTRFSEVTNWLNSSREQDNIIKRATARFSILDVINRVNETKTTKK